MMARAVGAYVISPTRLRKANFRAKIVNIHNIKIFTIFALKFTLRRRVGEMMYAPTARAIVNRQQRASSFFIAALKS